MPEIVDSEVLDLGLFEDPFPGAVELLKRWSRPLARKDVPVGPAVIRFTVRPWLKEDLRP